MRVQSRCSALLVASAVVAAPGTATTTVSVDVPIQVPSNSAPLASTLLSFSIEQDRWPDWSGIDERNEFTYSALETYANLTGQPPKIRVGGDSEDNTAWSPTVTIDEELFPSANAITPYPEATSITVGDELYRLSKWLPSGTHMIWGVNFGFDNVTNAVNIAQAIAGAFKSPEVVESGVILERLEIGNEVDIYGYTGHRNEDNWTVETYVPDWESVAGPVVEAVGIDGNDGPLTLQGASFAIHIWTPEDIFALGILNSTAGKTISTISQHLYSAMICDGGDLSLAYFMNKTAVRGNLSVFEADIAATHANGLGYVLGETNSIACHGAPGVSNTAGAALWTIDYALYASTIGISELYFHEGVGYRYNFLQPVTLNYSTINGSALDPPAPPHIQPPYYGGLVINTFIGNSGVTRIVELTINEPDTTGYAAFEDGQLVRAVFVNLHAWVANSTGTRPVVHIGLDFVNGTTTAVTATGQRLVIKYADDTQNLTWAGQSYEETADVRPTGQLQLETIELSEGLDLRATEAIVLTF